MSIIESGCRCGQRILIETESKQTCYRDGIRPHHPGDGPNVTAFTCRLCGGCLNEICSDLAALRTTPQEGGKQ